MPRRHAVDAQEADPLIGHEINVRPTRVDRDVVERPRQFYGEVALDDRARDRQHLAGVEGIVAEGKLEDLWRDCANDTAAQTEGCNERQTTRESGRGDERCGILCMFVLNIFAHF